MPNIQYRILEVGMNLKISMAQRQAIIADIANSDSLADALAKFKIASPLLSDCKIVLAANKGAQPGFAVNRTFSAGGCVRSLFNTPSVLVLDVDTVREMATGDATYPIDYSISLDTQALSYLEPYMNGGVRGGIPKDFAEVFAFIARNDVFVDPIPYTLENLHNLNQGNSNDEIFRRLKGYEVLRTLDQQRLRDKNEIRSTLTDSELTTRAQVLISQMFRDRDNSALMTPLNFRHQLMYSQLLKMALIQLRNPSGNIDRKIIEFAEFQDAEIGTMGAREMVLARAYFERGQDLTFFGKIQKKRDDIFKQLDGMAWDLWHVRQLEQAMTFKPSLSARYFFPALLTFDQRFIEVMDLYPLKACAFIEGTSEPMPFYDGDLAQTIAGDDEAQNAFLARFYSEQARTSREARRDDIKARIGDVVEALENELSALASVPVSGR